MTHKGERNTKWLLWVLPVVLVCAVVVLMLWNTFLLLHMQQKLLDGVRSSPEVALLDDACVYGKLNGNGNGINYYGAALVTADSEDAVKSLAEELGSEFEAVGYARQEGPQITSQYLEHRKLQLTYDAFQTGEDYYIIFFYNSRSPWSNLMDIAGH